MGWQPETQPKGKPPVEKTEGAETMQRLIDTQDTFNVLTDYYHHSTHVQHLALQEALNKVPTIDAEPVRHGKWINANEGRWNTCEVLKCSECGELDNRMYKTDKYCPNCGCRMDKDD